MPADSHIIYTHTLAKNTFRQQHKLLKFVLYCLYLFWCVCILGQAFFLSLLLISQHDKRTDEAN